MFKLRITVTDYTTTSLHSFCHINIFPKYFTGKLYNVEPITMNLSLSDVTFIGTDDVEIQFESFYVKGKNIRFVQIPDEVDMLKTIKK